MTEVSKEVKVIFLVNAIGAFLYTFLFLIIPEIYAQLIDAAPEDFSRITWRQLGGTFLIFGIFSILVVYRAEWENIKIFWEFAIAWIIMMLIIGIWAAVAISGTETRKYNTWLDNIVLILFIFINVYFYNQEKKKNI